MNEKIEVSKQFARFMWDLVKEAKRTSTDKDALSVQYRKRAYTLKHGDINTPEENLANSYIFQGEAEAYEIMAEKIEKTLTFFGLEDK